MLGQAAQREQGLGGAATVGIDVHGNLHKGCRPGLE